ncbi:hypothetical protein [Staphylococcus lugdunensis]|uniref:hypothetical protein n=1 Tax=Staphylococcus lugdunensis TaxID=28035 RepID=UPI000A18F920|nr:hypothetical protein [Staphylococcus lugdunensis]ARJ18138.1 hypothetical protein B7467_03665 [Staphylococcus lugdunensis]
MKKRIFLCLIFLLPIDFITIALDYHFQVGLLYVYIPALILPVIITFCFKWEKDFWLILSMKVCRFIISWGLAKIFIDFMKSAEYYEMFDGAGAIISLIIGEEIIFIIAITVFLLSKEIKKLFITQ